MGTIIQAQNTQQSSHQSNYPINTSSKKDGYQLSTSRYAEGYSLRKQSSTMTANTLKWIRKHSDKVLPQAPLERAAKILSIGCGDGELDIALLEALSPLHKIDYLGWDQNSEELALFKIQLRHSTCQDAPNIHIRLEQVLFDEHSAPNETFDLIVISHMLYYFTDPTQILRRAVQKLSKHGQLLIVHQCEEGIPSIRKQLFQTMNLGTLPQPSSTIKHCLAQLELPFLSHRVMAELDVSLLLPLEIKPNALLLMAFCLSEELLTLPLPMLNIVRETFLEEAYCNTSFCRAHISEPIDILLVPNVR